MMLVLVAIAGCSPAQGDPETSAASRSSVTITLDRSSYGAGSTARVTLTNGSLIQLGYNQCSSRSFERQEGARWSAVPEPERICTMELRLLNPKETQTFSVTLPSVQPGTYRLVLNLNRQGPTAGDPQPNTAVHAYSEPFRID